jgi:hypothetical protein
VIAFAGYLRLRARSASGDARPARRPRNGVRLPDQPRRYPDAPRGGHPYPETEAAS